MKTIITDGCTQEFMQIDIARENVFKNALHIRCGFHLVRMDWAHDILKKNGFPACVGYYYEEYVFI